MVQPSARAIPIMAATIAWSRRSSGRSLMKLRERQHVRWKLGMGERPLNREREARIGNLVR
jgi:hypothetical protein